MKNLKFTIIACTFYLASTIQWAAHCLKGNVSVTMDVLIPSFLVWGMLYYSMKE